MTRHPLDTEPTPARNYDADHARNDAMRDLPIARTYLVPPIAAYDIDAKLTEAIKAAQSDHQEAVRSRADGVEYEAGYLDGLRRAFCIVFSLDREEAP